MAWKFFIQNITFFFEILFSHLKGWEQKRSKCSFFTLNNIHLDLFGSHTSSWKHASFWQFCLDLKIINWKEELSCRVIMSPLSRKFSFCSYLPLNQSYVSCKQRLENLLLLEYQYFEHNSRGERKKDLTKCI